MKRGKPGGGIGVGANRCKSELSLQGEREWGDNLISTVLLTKKGIRTAREICRMPNDRYMHTE